MVDLIKKTNLVLQVSYSSCNYGRSVSPTNLSSQAQQGSARTTGDATEWVKLSAYLSIYQLFWLFPFHDSIP